MGKSDGKVKTEDFKKLASKVKAIEKNVAHETKMDEKNFAGTALNTGSLSCLTDVIVPGLNASNRIGDEITMKGFSSKILLKAPLVAGTTTNYENTNCRVMFLYDRNAGSGIAPGDILQTVNTSFAPLSFLNNDNKGRFQVLYDKNHKMGGTKENVILEISHRFKKGLNITWNNTLGSISKNHIYLHIINNRSAGTGTAFESTTRMYYSDN